MFKQFLPGSILKGLLLAVVYLTLSGFFIFYVPRTVPQKTDLETIRLPEDSLKLIYNKKANTSYFSAMHKGAELKTIKLTYKSGLKLYGTNEFFIQMKKRPEYYNLMIYKNKTLFNESYTIYQLAGDDEVLISYDISAKEIQADKDLFFYISIAFLALMGFILIKTIVVKIREKHARSSVY